MTEYGQAYKRIETISSELDEIINQSFWGGFQSNIESLDAELHGPMAAKVAKFQARLSEADPAKRTYGPAMELKVKNFLTQYDDLLQKFTGVAAAVTANSASFMLDQQRAAEAEAARRRRDSLARHQQQEEEERARAEAERLRRQEAAAAAMAEAQEQREMCLRRYERERAAQMRGEAEARQALEGEAARHLEEVALALLARQQREAAREDKRRRLGNLLEQHRQVKVKGERQLIEEAIAMSLQDTAACSSSPAAQDPMPLAAADPQAMDVDAEAAAIAPPAAELPPAPDLETEDVLIKQAIELSLQLSAATPCSQQSNPRADNTRDAQAP